MYAIKCVCLLLLLLGCCYYCDCCVPPDVRISATKLLLTVSVLVACFDSHWITVMWNSICFVFLRFFFFSFFAIAILLFYLFCPFFLNYISICDIFSHVSSRATSEYKKQQKLDRYTHSLLIDTDTLHMMVLSKNIYIHTFLMGFNSIPFTFASVFNRSWSQSRSLSSDSDVFVLLSQRYMHFSFHIVMPSPHK